MLTDRGLIPIEEIQVGDLVWAEDPNTGEKALKSVLQLFVSETHELVRLLIEDEIILATPGHPLHVKGKGWVQAFDLEPGDLVTRKDGKLATVYGIWYIYSENPVTVYNFEVADFHTYFVGDDSLLVHNMCAKEFVNKSRNAKQVISYLKENGFKVVSQKGSHVKLVYGSKTVIVPNHGGKDIAKGTLRSIMKQAGLL